MSDWLSGISITCFAASYTIGLVMEVSRLFFRAPIRLMLIIGLAAAGLFAHTVKLGLNVARELAASGLPLSSWHDWCLMASWVLAAVYLVMAVRRAKAAVGVFILPPILALVAAAYILQGVSPFPRAAALRYWGWIHGASLLLGTVIVTLGFVAGVMYLVQSYRLKHKMLPGKGLALPSLEWLQRANERALVVSSVLLAGGLISGLVMNLINQSGPQGRVAWTDPVVVTSGVLFLWLVVALSFNFLYKPARRGRKVAYLVVASFLFLALELGIVLFAQHASTPAEQRSNARQSVAGGER